MALRAPNEGRVFVDNEELRPEHFRSWYSKISYVSQTPFIFKGSLYENVTLRRDVSPSEIEGDTKFKDLVVQLSLSSVSSQSGAWISEGGTTLSGGQRQRIALARALYSDRPIVILDEFTSALDAQNSLRAQQLVNGENRKTFIIISHDTLSFISFNRVIRVTGGRVEELIGGE
jgi:ABC-type bacteriocin/lantibiotic exporter with double-glycine peptidase domain